MKKVIKNIGLCLLTLISFVCCTLSAGIDNEKENVIDNYCKKNFPWRLCLEVFDEESMKLAENGRAEPQFMIGYAYLFGVSFGDYEVKQDFKKANYWLKKAADQDYPIAQMLVGMFYEDGAHGEEKDLKKAFEMYGKAAKQNVAEAMYRKALFYCYVNDIAKLEEQEALELLTLAAFLGCCAADKFLETLEEEEENKKSQEESADGEPAPKKVKFNN